MASGQVMLVSSRKEKQPRSSAFTQPEGQAGGSVVVRRVVVVVVVVAAVGDMVVVVVVREMVVVVSAASMRTPGRSHMVTVLVTWLVFVDCLIWLSGYSWCLYLVVRLN